MALLNLGVIIMCDTNANPDDYWLLDRVLAEFVQSPDSSPGHDNANIPLEVEALYDPATYEYEYDREVEV
jgi:hypothetical protein